MELIIGDDDFGSLPVIAVPVDGPPDIDDSDVEIEIHFFDVVGVAVGKHTHDAAVGQVFEQIIQSDVIRLAESAGLVGVEGVVVSKVYYI